MLDFDVLFDYLVDDCVITIFDVNKGEDIEKNLSIDEARNYFEENSYNLCSIEPTPNVYFGITLNVEEE